MRRCTLYFVLLLFVVGGCDEPGRPSMLVNIAGTVTRNDQPTDGGGLIFVNPTGGLTVNASVHAGQFVAYTEFRKRSGQLERIPGVPRGTYRVIYYPPSNGAKDGLEVVVMEELVVDTDRTDVKFTLPNEMPKGNSIQRGD